MKKVFKIIEITVLSLIAAGTAFFVGYMYSPIIGMVMLFGLVMAVTHILDQEGE